MHRHSTNPRPAPNNGHLPRRPANPLLGRGLHPARHGAGIVPVRQHDAAVRHVDGGAGRNRVGHGLRLGACRGDRPPPSCSPRSAAYWPTASNRRTIMVALRRGFRTARPGRRLMVRRAGRRIQHHRGRRADGLLVGAERIRDTDRAGRANRNCSGDPARP